MEESNQKIRLQKYLSQSWICSRRKAEEYIRDGLILVNWKPAEIWQSINPDVDVVKMKNEEIKKLQNLVYYKLNKPYGIVTTCRQDWESSILDIINIKERVFPIGRLDKNTTWLIILTNDGRLSNYLIHPRYEHEKEYIVEVYGKISDEELAQMSEWVFILGKKTKRATIRRLSSWTFSIILQEWMNRQIRRMVEKVWHEVKKLKRVRIENILLGNLKEWQYEHLSNKELKELSSRLWIDLIN